MDYFSDDGETKCFCYRGGEEFETGMELRGCAESKMSSAAFASKVAEDRSASAMIRASVLADYLFAHGSDNYFSEKYKCQPGRFSAFLSQRVFGLAGRCAAERFGVGVSMIWSVRPAAPARSMIRRPGAATPPAAGGSPCALSVGGGMVYPESQASRRSPERYLGEALLLGAASLQFDPVIALRDLGEVTGRFEGDAAFLPVGVCG
jgi:hypothetical protein